MIVFMVAINGIHGGRRARATGKVVPAGDVPKGSEEGKPRSPEAPAPLFHLSNFFPL